MKFAGRSPSGKRVTIAVRTIGCRLNRYESDGIISRFASDSHYRVVSPGEKADIVIVNTCTVTDQADSRNRYAIRRLIRENPAVRVVVTGCQAQTDPEELRRLPGVELVVGNDRKAELYELVDRLRTGEVSSVATEKDGDDRRTAPGSGPLPLLINPFGYIRARPQGHTRAYLKIQDGCDRRCSYCKIPQARGAGVSRPFADIMEQVIALDNEGIPEIVLTGVNPGWYRDRRENIRFFDLLEEILRHLGQARLRLSSVEPGEANSRLGEISLHPRFCNFLHVPLQSGSRKVLQKMNRHYTPRSYRKRIETLRQRNSDLFLGTDLIVGFPGETEEDFEETIALLNELRPPGLHLFPFSPRRGTPAAELAGRPSAVVVRRRMNLLGEMKVNFWREYAGRYLGQTLEAAVERTRGDCGRALTDNFLRLEWESDADPKNDPQPGELRYFRLLEIKGEGRILAAVVSSTVLPSTSPTTSPTVLPSTSPTTSPIG